MVSQVPEPTPEIISQLLALPTEGRGATIRSYLADLLCALWKGDADPKYGMTGESDWQYDLYRPMQAAGLIPEWQDGWGVGYRIDGSRVKDDQRRADVLICAAIQHMTEERP